MDLGRWPSMTDRLPQQAVAQKFLESLKAGFAWPLVAWTRGPNLCGVKEFSVMSSCYGLCKFAMLLYMKPWQKVSSIHIVPVLLGLMAFQWPFAIAVLIESVLHSPCLGTLLGEPVRVYPLCLNAIWLLRAG